MGLSWNQTLILHLTNALNASFSIHSPYFVRSLITSTKWRLIIIIDITSSFWLCFGLLIKTFGQSFDYIHPIEHVYVYFLSIQLWRNEITQHNVGNLSIQTSYGVGSSAKKFPVFISILSPRSSSSHPSRRHIRHTSFRLKCLKRSIIWAKRLSAMINSDT